MKERRTLEYDWEHGQEELTIKVDSYLTGGGLYIGLYCEEEGEEEAFGDLTVNLPFEQAEVNEAYIADFGSKDKLKFIRKHKLGKVLPEFGYSGYCKYAKVAFDLERLAGLDPEGVERYRLLHGLTPKPETAMEETD